MTTIILGGAGNPVLATAFAAGSPQIAWGTREDVRLVEIVSSAGVPPENDRGPLEFVWTLPQKDDAIASPQPVPEKWQLRWMIRDEHSRERESPFARAVSVHEGVRVLVKPGGSLGWKSERHVLGWGRYRRNAILIIRNGSHTTFIERNAASGSGHLACGITPDGKTVISGGKDGVLAAYDLEGRKLGDFAGHSGDVLALAPSPDGRYLVSGASDQTVRLWNLRTYELLVTMFYAADGEWAIWTPQGYYAASPDGGKLFGWQINRGPERNADYVAAERLRTRFHRPDVVARAIIVGSGKEAAARAAGNDPSLEELFSVSPPGR